MQKTEKINQFQFTNAFLVMITTLAMYAISSIAFASLLGDGPMRAQLVIPLVLGGVLFLVFCSNLDRLKPTWDELEVHWASMQTMTYILLASVWTGMFSDLPLYLVFLGHLVIFAGMNLQIKIGIDKLDIKRDLNSIISYELLVAVFTMGTVFVALVNWIV